MSYSQFSVVSEHNTRVRRPADAYIRTQFVLFVAFGFLAVCTAPPSLQGAFPVREALKSQIIRALFLNHTSFAIFWRRATQTYGVNEFMLKSSPPIIEVARWPLVAAQINPPLFTVVPTPQLFITAFLALDVLQAWFAFGVFLCYSFTVKMLCGGFFEPSWQRRFTAAHSD